MRNVKQTSSSDVRKVIAFSLKVRPDVLEQLGYWDNANTRGGWLNKESRFLLTADDLGWPELYEYYPDEHEAILAEARSLFIADDYIEINSPTYDFWLEKMPPAWLEKRSSFLSRHSVLAAFTIGDMMGDFDSSEYQEHDLISFNWECLGFDVINIHVDSVLAIMPYDEVIREKYSLQVRDINDCGLFSSEAVAREWADIANTSILPQHAPFTIVKVWIKNNE